MEAIKSIAGGLTGATALTAVHEILRKNIKNAPEVDKLGMQAIKKIAGKKAPEKKENLYRLALASDIISNTLYYSLTGTSKRPVLTGLMLGAGAGAGVILIPALTGLNEKYSTRTFKTAAMSFGYYFMAGLVSGGIIKLLRSVK
ncbi:hypothetical protein RCC89_02305 [Cytophagaceae bacterium ABcell3]|nr:hypothetical protein RCC89_02305 [Cytophagaceae bacterium ABcell3]